MSVIAVHIMKMAFVFVANVARMNIGLMPAIGGVQVAAMPRNSFFTFNFLGLHWLVFGGWILHSFLRNKLHWTIAL